MRSVLAALAWLAIVIVISLGAAGLATGLDQVPGTSGPVELTAEGDAEVVPLLDDAETGFEALADQVEQLGIQARGALAALNGVDPAITATAIATGDGLVADIERRTDALRASLAAVPYVGEQDAGLRVSEHVVARHAALVVALDATDGLDASWDRLSVGAVSASRMSALLAEHDRLMGVAVERGRVAKYGEALKLIDQAEAQLADARTLRDQLAKTVEVAVLDEWIKRNATYDVALRDLYTAIPKVGKKVTAATRAAVKAEAAARAQLPPDTRALVVIMADIGRGGMNGAVIAIEEARASLADALDSGATSASPEPEVSPGP